MADYNFSCDNSPKNHCDGFNAHPNECDAKFKVLKATLVPRRLDDITEDTLAQLDPDSYLYVDNDGVDGKIKVSSLVNISQADWNQTDSTKDSFIKNKPFQTIDEDTLTVDNNKLKVDSSIINDISEAKVDILEIKEDLEDKQDKLISGTNIKTINNQSILGGGNITIEGGGNVNDVKVNGVSVVVNKVANVTVPTKVSDLTNDSQFTSKSYVDGADATLQTNITNEVNAREQADTTLQNNINLKQNKLIAGANITIDQTTNTISATDLTGITKIKMNGEEKSPTSEGVVDLGTVITSHQDISGKADKTYVDYELVHKQDIMSAGYGININNNTIKVKAADKSIAVGEFGIHVPVITTSLEITDNGVAVKMADNSIIAYNDGQGTKGIKVNQDVIQQKLVAGDNININGNSIAAVDTKYTAGTNITIDSNNVISATSSSTLQQAINVGVNLGRYEIGDNIPIGTSLETILRNILSAPDPKYVLSLSVSPSGSGTVTGAGSYKANTEVNISAVAANGYTFSKWSDNDTNASRTIVMPSQNKSLTASFIANTYNISYTQGEHGTISGASSATYKSTVNVSVVPDSGYILDKLYVNGSAISGTSFTMPAQNTTISVLFKVAPIVINKIYYGACGDEFTNPVESDFSSLTSEDVQTMVGTHVVTIQSASGVDYNQFATFAVPNSYKITAIKTEDGAFAYDLTKINTTGSNNMYYAGTEGGAGAVDLTTPVPYQITIEEA